MLRTILGAFVVMAAIGCGSMAEKKEPGGLAPADQLFDKSKQPQLKGDGGKKSIAG